MNSMKEKCKKGEKLDPWNVPVDILQPNANEIIRKLGEEARELERKRREKVEEEKEKKEGKQKEKGEKKERFRGFSPYYSE